MFSVRIATSVDDRQVNFAIKCLSKKLNEYFGSKLLSVSKSSSLEDENDILNVYTTPQDGKEMVVYQNVGVPGSLAVKVMNPRIFSTVTYLILHHLNPDWHPELDETQCSDLLKKAIRFYSDPFATMTGDLSSFLNCSKDDLKTFPICAEAYAGSGGDDAPIDRLIWAYYLCMPAGDKRSLLIGEPEERPILKRLFSHFCVDPDLMSNKEFLDFVRSPLFDILAPRHLSSKRQSILDSKGRAILHDDQGLSLDDFATIVFHRPSFDKYTVDRIFQLDQKALDPVDFTQEDKGLLSLLHFSHDALCFIEYIFQLIDVDNSGVVEPSELEPIRKYLEENKQRRDLQGVVDLSDAMIGMDVNADGQVTLNEWLAFFGKVTVGDPQRLPILMANDLNLYELMFSLPDHAETLEARKASALQRLITLARKVADVDEKGAFASEIAFMDYSHHLFNRLPSEKDAKEVIEKKQTVERLLFRNCEDKQDVEDTVGMIEANLDIPVVSMEKIAKARAAQTKANVPAEAKALASQARLALYSVITTSKHCRSGDFHPVAQDAEMLITQTYRADLTLASAEELRREALTLLASFKQLLEDHSETLRLVSMIQSLGKVGRTRAPHANRLKHALGRTFDVGSGLANLAHYKQIINKELPTVEQAVMQAVQTPRLHSYQELQSLANAAVAAFEEKKTPLPLILVQVAAQAWPVKSVNKAIDTLVAEHKGGIRLFWSLAHFSGKGFPDKEFGRQTTDLWSITWNPSLDGTLPPLGEVTGSTETWGFNEKFRFERLGLGKVNSLVSVFCDKEWITLPVMFKYLKKHGQAQQKTRRTSSITTLGSMGSRHASSPRANAASRRRRKSRGRGRNRGRESPKSRRSRRRGRSKERRR